METNLYSYSIMRLNVPDDQILNVCEDIKNQYLTGVSSCPLFSMTLVPEGKTPMDKVYKTCAKYKKFKDILDEMGIPTGVLIQASLGHGYVLGEKFTFQGYVGFEDGIEQEVACPADKDFQQYIYDMIKEVAKLNPKTIMIDDDLRLIARPGKGCACPLHLKMINDYLGENLTREELLEKSKTDKKYYDAFVNSQQESLVNLSKIIRKAIDDVNPDILCADCGGGGYSAKMYIEIAKTLAGKNPSILRISNGRYCFGNKRHFAFSSLRANRSIQKINGEIDLILAEADTCPHNRYATDASELHTQYVTSLLDGCKGAKHWLTRGPYEPNSGIGYRKILAKYTKFYEQIAKDVEGIKWLGFNNFISPRQDVPDEKECGGGWVCWAFEPLGLPTYFSTGYDGIICVESTNDTCASVYTDEEIINILSNDCFLDYTTAKIFEERGFGKYLGVSVQEKGETPINGEVLAGDTVALSLQSQLHKLVITNENTVVDCYAYNTIDQGITKNLIFPSVTVFKNELGGNVVVFAGTPAVKRDWHTGFGYLTETRKKEFINLMQSVGKLPIYYPGDIEVYLRAGYMPNGTMLASVINMSADEIEGLDLYIEKDVTEIKVLTPQGEKVSVPFTKNGNMYTIDINVYCLKPAILYID